jgi:hypothetical protein
MLSWPSRQLRSAAISWRARSAELLDIRSPRYSPRGNKVKVRVMKRLWNGRVIDHVDGCRAHGQGRPGGVPAINRSAPELDGRNARIKLQGAFNPFRHPKQAMVLAISADDLDAEGKTVFAESRGQ